MAELVFKSEKERSDAYDKVPEVDDAPVGTNIEEYRVQIDQQLQDIDNAKIIAEGAPIEKKIEQKPVTKPIQNDPVNSSSSGISKEEAEIELLRNRNRDLEQLRSDADEAHNERILKFEEKLEKLEASITQPNNTIQKEKPKTGVDHETIAVQNEIEELEKLMNDEDADVYDESYIKNLKKIGTLNQKLNRLLHTKHSDEMRIHTAELNDLKNKQNLEKENTEKADNKNIILSRIAKFREDMIKAGDKSFEGKPYEQMDEDYTDFSKKVASVWYGKSEAKITNAERELAIDKYMNNTPALVEALKTRGIEEPDGMRTFITLSEINATKMGYRLNKATGKWVQMKDDDGDPVKFPSHEAAYNYIKGNDRGRELLEAQRKAALNVTKAINTRANPIELNDPHKGENTNEMTREAAHNLLNTWDEEQVELKRRRNSNDPMVIEYNKALVTLGHSPLAGD